MQELNDILSIEGLDEKQTKALAKVVTGFIENETVKNLPATTNGNGTQPTETENGRGWIETHSTSVLLGFMAIIIAVIAGLFYPILRDLQASNSDIKARLEQIEKSTKSKQ